MNKGHGVCCILLGAALLIAALSLVLYNNNENKKGEESARGILEALKENIPDQPTTEPFSIYIPGNDLFAEYTTEPETEPEETTMIVDEHGYIGYISIPSLGVELPVMSTWGYTELRLSPCRYKGTIHGRNIIIAAHNYRSHFGRLNTLYGGEEIIFTDVEGNVFVYEVSEITEMDGKDIEQMDFGAAKDWDLTLFTCTLGGRSRVTVRAVLKEE